MHLLSHRFSISYDFILKSRYFELYLMSVKRFDNLKNLLKSVLDSSKIVKFSLKELMFFHKPYLLHDRYLNGIRFLSMSSLAYHR